MASCEGELQTWLKCTFKKQKSTNIDWMKIPKCIKYANRYQVINESAEGASRNQNLALQKFEHARFDGQLQDSTNKFAKFRSNQPWSVICIGGELSSL